MLIERLVNLGKIKFASEFLDKQIFWGIRKSIRVLCFVNMGIQ